MRNIEEVYSYRQLDIEGLHFDAKSAQNVINKTERAPIGKYMFVLNFYDAFVLTSRCLGRNICFVRDCCYLIMFIVTARRLSSFL